MVKSFHTALWERRKRENTRRDRGHYNLRLTVGVEGGSASEASGVRKQNTRVGKAPPAVFVGCIRERNT